MQCIRLQPKGLAVAVVAALMVAGVVPAAAQDAATKSNVKSDTKPGEKPEAKTLDTLVVTAQKREELLQDVPVTVTALSQQALQDAGVRDIKDLQVLVPGLTVTSTQSEAITTARLRGIGTVGDNIGLESSVGVVIDGVYRPRNSVGFGDLGELERIEVLKGPSTLLYGSGAIGGAVNVVDGRIPDGPVDNGFSGRAETRFFGGDQGGNTTMARIDGGNDRVALHADAVYRHAPDYTTPDGRQYNSYIDTRSGALGGSLLGDWGYVGLSASRFNDEYGNPGEPGNPVLGERGVYLKMHQDRYEAKGALRDLWGAGNGLRFSLAHTGYEHTEFEGDQPGTVFRKNANEGRVEATFGSRDGWQGALGTQLSASTFLAIGEEAFVPQTSTRAWGVFGVARRSWDGFQLDLGARVDNVKSSPVAAASRDFRPLSLSLAGGWKLSDAWKLTLNLDRAERAPVEEELFSDGPHIATLAYEIGNAGLRKEAANQLELGLQYQADWVEAKVSAYYNRFDNFIYLADTGNTWYWAEGDRDLPVRQWTQANARFRGLEGEASFHLARNDSGDWDLRVFGDSVRATLANGGGNLPRIAPARLGAQLRWQHEGWRAALGATRTSRQNDVAVNEMPTAGYTLVDAHLSRHFDSGNLSWELFADGSNLTNQVARVHTSFLKDQVMLPGRSVGFGVRVFF